MQSQNHHHSCLRCDFVNVTENASAIASVNEMENETATENLDEFE